MFVALVASFCLCAVTLPGLIATLRRRGALDVPNLRSSHAEPTPRGGGLAVVGAILGTYVCLALAGRDLHLLWLVPVAVMGLIGAVDDFRPLSARLRLLIQALTSGLTGVAIFGVSSTSMWLSAILSALLLVAFTNAFNFMDGINGVAAMTAIVGCCWFIALGQVAGNRSLTYLAAASLGACLAFLPFNFPAARVFLGDSGSYSLGFMLALLAVAASQVVEPWPTALAPLIVFGADTGATLVSRVWKREALLEAHREHLYQRLARYWDSHVRAAAFVVAFTASACVAAAWGYSSGSATVQVALLGFIGLAYVGTSHALIRRRTALV